MKLPFDISRAAVDFADRVTGGTLSGVRDLLSHSMTWTAEQLNGLAAAADAVPLLPEQTRFELVHGLRDAGRNLEAARDATTQAFGDAVAATGDAFRTAVEALDLADRTTAEALFENIQVSSIVGDSFAGWVPTSKIVPSFRLPRDGGGYGDVSAEAVAADFVNGKRKKIVVGVPGLFCDESVWIDSGMEALLGERGYYFVKMRFNPGAHISDNGRRLGEMLDELLAALDAAGVTTGLLKDKKINLDFLTYSQGGLVLRSALYYAVSERDDRAFPARTGRAVMIASPDGGSYIEKIGFWLGFGLEFAPLTSLKALGFIGNQRSDAMKDLSHGIIREEDWKERDPVERHLDLRSAGKRAESYYFGELDDVDAYQLYGVIKEDCGDARQDFWRDWLGDGVVETDSLESLSETVFRKKSRPENRVHVFPGLSHFQVVGSPEVQAVVRQLLS